MWNPNKFNEKLLPPMRYTLAVAIFLIALTLRFLASPVESGLLFMTFYPAMIISFYLCGIGPGMVVVALCAVSADYIFAPPFWSFNYGKGAINPIVTFLISSFIIGWIIEQLRRENYKNIALLRNASDGIHILDPEGGIIEVSDSFCAMLGYRRDEMIGMRVDQWDANLSSTDVLRQVGQQFAKQERTQFEARHRRKDGSILDVEVSSFPLELDGTPVLFNSSRDITERKRAEEEIKVLNRELEQRVVMRTADLEASNKELETFSYSVSHDLRTPLRAIDGFSRILLDDYANKLDDEGKRLLNVVRDNTRRMGQLIDDILQFSRSSRLEMIFSEFDMEKLACEVVEELQPADGKLQVEIGPIPPATGDRAMMRQVFVNLLSNAIKFSSRREIAIIKVGGSIQGNEAVYYVKDNGAGFDMKYADKLFGVFQRLHAVGDFEGTGIGLAIVKRIITRHGGRVWAEGKPNEGATIYFALPSTKEKIAAIHPDFH